MGSKSFKEIKLSTSYSLTKLYYKIDSIVGYMILINPVKINQDRI